MTDLEENAYIPPADDVEDVAEKLAIQTLAHQQEEDPSGLFDVGYLDGQDDDIAYGKPCSPEIAQETFGDDHGEQSMYCVIWKDDNKVIKPRRGIIEVTAKNFFSSLVKTPDGRYMFSGVLNGWGGLNLVQLVALDKIKLTKNNEYATTPKVYWKFYSNEKKKKRMTRVLDPAYPAKIKDEAIRGTIYLPAWKNKAYSKGVPGQVWYFAGCEVPRPRFSHGANIIEAIKKCRGGDVEAKMVYHFGHRYAKEVETTLDKMSYHTGLFVEWEHGEFGTIFELAWLNGIGGYKGMSNWVEDKNAKPWPALYSAMPAFMKLPWNSTRSELRIIDVPMKSVKDFEAYLEKYNDPKERFLDPKIKESSVIKVSPRKRSDLVKYCVNRIVAHNLYSEPSLRKRSVGYNCQTFAAEFYGFLTNTKGKTLSFPMTLPLPQERKKWFAEPYDGKEFAWSYDK